MHPGRRTPGQGRPRSCRRFRRRTPIAVSAAATPAEGRTITSAFPWETGIPADRALPSAAAAPVARAAVASCASAGSRCGTEATIGRGGGAIERTRPGSLEPPPTAARAMTSVVHAPRKTSLHSVSAAPIPVILGYDQTCPRGRRAPAPASPDLRRVTRFAKSSTSRKSWFFPASGQFSATGRKGAHGAGGSVSARSLSRRRESSRTPRVSSAPPSGTSR